MTGAKVNRRAFLTAATAGTVAAQTLATRPAAAAEPTDVIIIGSGYAGSTAALRLSQAGVPNTVLERGRRWTITEDGNTFCTGSNPDGRALWLGGTSPVLGRNVPRYTGVLETVVGLGIICLAGAGVGGGSLVNNAVMMEPDEADFARAFGNRLGYGSMHQIWYPRARTLIGASPIPDDILNSTHYENARQAQAELRAAGIPALRADLAVDWSIVRDEIAGAATPSLISGQCIFGVNSGAKRSVDQTILAEAENTGHTYVRELTAVTDITRTRNGYEVAVQKLDTAGAVVQRQTLRAKKVILAAGSLNSTLLLLRARAKGTIPSLPQAIGSQWGTGGDGIVLFGGRKNPQPAVGGPAHIVGRYRATSGLPVGLLNFPLGVPLIDSVARESLAVGHVPPIGRLSRTSSDGILPYWPQHHREAIAARTAMGEMVRTIDTAVPDRDAWLSTQLLTSHALGGATLSNVTDGAGRVSGTQDLFVMDSSLIPGSTGGVPPALTVTALADRCITTGLEEGAFAA